MSNITKEQMALLSAKFDIEKRRQDNLDINQMLKQGDFMLPLTGGNTIPIEIYKYLVDNADASMWKWLQIYQDYFISMWELKGANKQEEQAWAHYLCTLFWFGLGAIRHDGEKLLAYGANAVVLDENQNIEEANIWINNINFMGKSKNQMVFNKISVKAKDYVFGKLNHNGVPLIIMLFDYIKDTTKMISALKTNIAWTAKKVRIIQKNNMSEVIKEELNSMLDTTNPIVVVKSNFGTSNEIPNKIEPLETPKPELESLLVVIKNYMGLMNQHLGIFTNTNVKTERSITADFKDDEFMIKIQLKKITFELEYVVEQMNEKFGKKYEVINYMDRLEMEWNQAETEQGQNQPNAGQGQGKSSKGDE